MLARLLLIAGLSGLIGLADGYAQTGQTREPAPAPRPQPQRPKKPRDEPKKPDEEPKKSEGTKGKGSLTKSATPPKAGQPKKYDDVITKDAKTQPGVFAVHRIDEKVYFEIPADKLEKLMMFRAEVARGAGGGSFNGTALGTKFIRFERRENKIYVIEAGFDKRSDEAMKAAVEASGVEPIIASFPVEAEGKDRSAVISVANVFLNDSMDIGARRAGGGSGTIDSEKSYLTEVKAFPLNIEVRALLTSRGGGGGGPGGPGGPFGGGGGANRPSTALVHYSLFMLPENPMQPRYFDSRVGYFTESYYDYAHPKTWVTERQLIARFRLEKKDPSAEVSEPVKPITFYLSPEIPEKYREAMRKGVEDWKPAFEAAGFKNAIVCKDPPSKAEDPNWDPEDVRHSVIRWVAEPVANAMGPHVHDPRSGEIISAHIIFWHDILKITQLWYFVQCSAVDKRAQKLPLPDELTSELIRYVTAHEVGHTLGLRHNHRASQAYSVEQLRDPEFVKKHGSVASIMSYGRFNYVAQPEDKIDVKDLIPKLAPYDVFAIKWGYKPIPAASSPEAEKSTLDDWAAMQIKDPFLRFGGEDGPSMVDPTVLTENIGSDPVKATALGLKNMDRMFAYLTDATTVKGEDFEVLQEAYQALLTHRRNWFGAVVKQVGGVIENRTLAGRGEQFSRVPKDKQQAAVKFLLDVAFATPKNFLDPALVNQFKYSGVASDVMNQQRAILTSLLSSSRLGRLMDAEVLSPDDSYTVTELVTEVQNGVWSELKEDAPKVDPLRRNLQRAYIDLLKAEFDSREGGTQVVTLPDRPRRGGIDFGGAARTSELRATARIALRDLKGQIEAALPKVKDVTTRAHLQDSLSVIDSVLEVNNNKK